MRGEGMRVDERGRDRKRVGGQGGQITAISMTNHCKIDCRRHGMVQNRSSGWRARDRLVDRRADRPGC
eukprot:3819466-Rhodomonas_salina.1